MFSFIRREPAIAKANRSIAFPPSKINFSVGFPYNSGSGGGGDNDSGKNILGIPKIDKSVKDLGSRLCETLMLHKNAPVRVLLVEDVQADAELAEVVFKEQGCLVDHVFTGEHAIEYVKREKFDAALIDLKLPGISGIETAKKLIGYAPCLVIFICSGYQLPEGAVKEALTAGYMVLPKPLVREHVSMILSEVKKKMGSSS